jgi:hypothetical protein
MSFIKRYLDKCKELGNTPNNLEWYEELGQVKEWILKHDDKDLIIKSLIHNDNIIEVPYEHRVVDLPHDKVINEKLISAVGKLDGYKQLVIDKLSSSGPFLTSKYNKGWKLNHLKDYFINYL